MTAEPILAVLCAAAHPLAPELLCALLPHDPKVVEHSSNGHTWATTNHASDEEDRNG